MNPLCVALLVAHWSVILGVSALKSIVLSHTHTNTHTGEIGKVDHGTFRKWRRDAGAALFRRTEV